jgi:hypothetical protein
MISLGVFLWFFPFYFVLFHGYATVYQRVNHHSKVTKVTKPTDRIAHRIARSGNLRIQVDFIALQHEARHVGPDGIAHRLRRLTTKKLVNRKNGGFTMKNGGFTMKNGGFTMKKLVNITPISLWFMVDISIINGVYKPTYNQLTSLGGTTL